jgi:hypothetical protein
MKNPQLTDDTQQKLTSMLDEIITQTHKMQTYTNTIENLLSMTVNLPIEILNETQTFIKSNKNLGYTSQEEFILDAIRIQLKLKKDQYTSIEVPKEDYDRIQQALQDLGTNYLSAEDFINQQIQSLLTKHQEMLEEKSKYDQKS